MRRLWSYLAAVLLLWTYQPALASCDCQECAPVCPCTLDCCPAAPGEEISLPSLAALVPTGAPLVPLQKEQSTFWLNGLAATQPRVEAPASSAQPRAPPVPPEFYP